MAGNNINFNNLFLSRDTLNSVVANTGAQSQLSKGTLGKAAENPDQDVFQFQQQVIREHGLELAEFSGVTHQAHEDQGKVEERQNQNREHQIEQDQVGHRESEKPEGQQVLSPKGVPQTLDSKNQARLQEMDSSLYSALQLNADLNPEALAAAKKMVESKPAKKNAQLKHVPEAESAMKPELASAPTLTAPLDICEAGSDNQPPLQIEPDQGERDIAQRYAAERLANGEADEAMIAGQ